MMDKGEIDWDVVKSRVAHLVDLASAEATWESPDGAEAILQERARELAKRSGEQGTEESIEVVVFLVGEEKYALQTLFTQQVVRPGRFVSAPCAPPFLVGIFNYRGQLLPIVDLASVLGPFGRQSVIRDVLVVGVGDAEMAIVTDAIEDVTSIEISAILQLPDSISTEARRFLRGATRDGITILNGNTLVEDPAFKVE